MFSHMTLGSNDLPRSRSFYDAALGALGIPKAVEDAKGRLIYAHAGALLIVTRPLDGEPAMGGNGTTVGFAAASPAEIDAWHAAGLAAGGRSIEDPPGVREMPGRRLYLAYLRDPDGNKLCAMHRMAAEG